MRRPRLLTQRSSRISSTMAASQGANCSGGKGWPLGQLATHDTHGMGEGKPVGIECGFAGRLVHEQPHGPVRQEQAVEFLFD